MSFFGLFHRAPHAHPRQRRAAVATPGIGLDYRAVPRASAAGKPHRWRRLAGLTAFTGFTAVFSDQNHLPYRRRVGPGGGDAGLYG